MDRWLAYFVVLLDRFLLSCRFEVQTAAHMHCIGGCALFLQPTPAVCMQTCIAQTHHRWEGTCGCWVGSHIGSHDKMHTQDIILFTKYCALFAHVLCMHDGPRDHAQNIGLYCYIPTPVGKVNGWLDFDPMQGGQWVWLGWGFRVVYHL